MTVAAARAAEPAGTRAGRLVIGVLVGLTLLRLAFLAWGDLDLSPDEAHYWEWSRRLDLSYYSKGPLIAYLIAGLTALLGPTAFAIRTGAVLLSVVGAWALYRLGREAYGRPEPGALAVIGLQVAPLVWAGSLITTIDAPFMAVWTLALWTAHRALTRDSTTAWILTGVLVGLGALAKYTMLFVVPGLVLYLLLAPERRPRLHRAGPWLAATAAALVFSPVVLWNARQDWVSLRHVAAQGRGRGLTLVHVAEFLGSQLLVLTPLLAVLLAWGCWVGVREGFLRRREPYRFLLAFTVPILAFYLLVGLQGKLQANWTAAAYPSLALAAGGLLVERWRDLDARGRRRQARLLGAAVGLALVASLLGHLSAYLGIPPKLDPTTRLRGWAELGRSVRAELDRMPSPGRTFLVSDRYQVTSELAFYTPGDPPTYNFNLGRRLNQYDFWEGPDRRVGWDAIFVGEGTATLPATVAQAFERVDAPVVVEIRRGDRVIRTFALHRAYGFRGTPAPPAAVRF